jgi:hypothetical protein
MNNKFSELTKLTIKLDTRRKTLKRFGLVLVGAALASFALSSVSRAQTSVVCDPAGDGHYGNGKGGPNVPAWFDITQSTIADFGDKINFTLTLAAPMPMIPAWENAEDGGQFWWGYRIVGDGEHLGYVSDGCLFTKGNTLPAGYFLDLIWNVQTASFRARLLDDTSCAQSDIPFSFSADRTQVSLVVAKALFSNPSLVPDPNRFQYFAVTLLWRGNPTPSNQSLQHLDEAPDQPGGPFVLGTWSASGNTSYGCP